MDLETPVPSQTLYEAFQMNTVTQTNVTRPFSKTPGDADETYRSPMAPVNSQQTPEISFVIPAMNEEDSLRCLLYTSDAADE